MSDGFEKQTWAPTVPKSVYVNDLSLEISIFGGQESTQLSRLLDVLPTSCTMNAVNSGLAEASKDDQIQAPVVQKHRVL